MNSFDLNKLIIEKINPNDIDQVAEIEKECFSKPWTAKMIEESLENAGSIFIVAKFEDKVIGYMGANLILGECYINNIAVTSDFRRLGIAKEILNKFIEIVQEKGCEMISLEVRKSNEKAQKLYQLKQFLTIGERKDYYNNPTENALIMTKYFD